jgi:hypothetical protein
MPRLTPAETVIKDFGVRPLAKELGVDPTTIIRWRSHDGLVPSAYHLPLIALAKRMKKPLVAEELVMGRMVR